MGACLRAEHAVGGAAHPGRATVEDVCVDHRRGDVAVPEEFLNRADVVPVFEQVSRDEWRNVWHLAGLTIPARRTASFIARWGTDSCR